jgi:hypothetical protein
LGWIVIVDWRWNKKTDKWEIKEIYHAKVGSKIKSTKIKPDVFYWFEDGKLKNDSKGAK